MAGIEDIAKRATKKIARAHMSEWQLMLTGKRVDETTVTLSGAPAGMTWVRGYDTSREETAVFGKVESVNIPVWVGKGPSGARQIMMPDYEEGAIKFGDAIASVVNGRVFANKVRYTPAVAGNYDTTPTTAQAALDELAGRVEGAETDIADHETRIDDLETVGSANFGTGVIKTLSSGVATAGSDRHLILAAESGTADDCIEISGLSVGDEVIVRADSGDTITLKHNDAGATDKIVLYNAGDIALTGDQTIKLVKTTSGKVVQYVDQTGAGGGLSSSSNFASGNVTLTTSGTYYDVGTLSLAAGTWHVTASVMGNLNTTATITIKIWDGSTVWGSGSQSGASGYNVQANAIAIVTLATTTTVKVSAKANANNQTVLAAVGEGNNASGIVAVKIA